MAAEEAEGDRVIEVVSAGALYRSGGDWERKYWSSSRGKDRYPYPVGYHAVRHFSGISFTMEIQQGPRGPIFLVTSTEGDSATGETPDFAWKNLQKKTGAKVRNWQRRKSFPQKIDGAELFGFKNASVQRLLREVIVDSTGTVELKLPCSVTSEAAVPLTHKDAADVSEAEDLPVCLGIEGGTCKRSIEPSQVERPSKRVHYQDMFTSVDNRKRVPAGRALLEDVSDSRCTLSLLEEVPGNSKYISCDDNLGEPSPVSSQQVGLSSGSYLSSEKTDIELAEKEVAKSMMSILLPQAIPLLKKINKKKKSKRKKKEKSTVSVRTASPHIPSDGRCQGLTVPTIIGEGISKNSSGMCDNGGSHCDMVKNGFADDDCTNVFKLGKMNGFVADSFEDDTQILGDNTSKSVDVHHHESDDACSRGPDENLKLLYGRTEGHAKLFECQVGVHDGTNAPDVVFDHEKGQYILSDSLLACLEEEFGGEDSSHPANCNQYNGIVEQLQFNDFVNGTKNGSSESMDVLYHKSIGNKLIDVCSQAITRHGSAVSKNGERLANVLHAPVHSNAHNDAAEWDKHGVSSTLTEPPSCEAKSSLLDLQDEQHTEVPAIDQKENRFHGVNYECKKSNDPLQKSNTSYHSDDVEFIDKYVAFEPSEKARHSNDGPQGESTTEVCPVGDGPNVDKGNLLGEVEECQAGCRNGNKNTIIPVCRESNVCERIPPKGEHEGFDHQQGHALSVTNCTHGLGSECTKAQARRSGHHLELVGCYLHPMPVLSIMLNTKNHSRLYIYVLCGLLESYQRSVYVYTVTKDQQDAPPCFVGYTTLLLPSLDQSSAGNISLARSGLHFTPDGQFVVLLSCIRIPFCRMQNIDCLCSVCKMGRCEDNSLKIVSVNLGYVSLVTKLLPNGTVSCILICEPNYIVACEDSRNLHIWEMVNGWSEISEQYVIPSLGNVGPSVLELRRMPKSHSLIMGHDGAGGFCLWDISKRTLLAIFAAPGNIVFQILPVGLCSLQEDIVHAPVDDIDKKLRGITISGMSRKIDQESFMTPPREDIAVWVLISSASVAEYQCDLQTKVHNARWRLALLAKKRIIMGNILDTRVTALDASGNYGFAGTHGGLLYLWELSSGRKLTGTQCFNRGPVSCVAVDAKSGAVAVTDGGCQVLLYTQDKVLTDAGTDQHMFRMDKVTVAES
ncbi:hypothetical protein SETIT_2G140800v2 [Setaria italica]|uniref:Uncharacterized protein n=1 Tax=Setaria italica TaxID=4555 RepID=A0A368PYW2_SETIT|nr:uncharacterized protein LOC101754000 isoform X2 [Setaria italica]RCV10839.1 hypothetical protein SETIT_2G140800v2 [Setaria italica]